MFFFKLSLLSGPHHPDPEQALVDYAFVILVGIQPFTFQASAINKESVVTIINQ